MSKGRLARLAGVLAVIGWFIGSGFLGVRFLLPFCYVPWMAFVMGMLLFGFFATVFAYLALSVVSNLVIWIMGW